MKYCNQLRLLCCSHERVHFQNKSFHTDCRQITSYFRNAKVGHVTSRCVAQVKFVGNMMSNIRPIVSSLLQLNSFWMRR